MLDRLARVPDPRSRQGRRHEIGYVLAVTVAATLACGHDSVSALAEWAAGAPADLLAELGGRIDPLTGVVAAPSRPTLGRVLARVDAAKLQALASDWALTHLDADRPGIDPARAGAEDRTDTDTADVAAGDVAPGDVAPGDVAPGDVAPGDVAPGDVADNVIGTAARSPRLPAVAIDGKSVRGAAAGGRHRPHLLAAARHDGIVLTQRQIPDKGSEISEVKPLIADLNLTGHVITIDALHTQRATAEHLVAVKGAHYVMTVKPDQPTLLAACQAALSGPADDFAQQDITVDRGHGRTEQRTTRTTPVTADSGIDFPHAAQAFRVIRHTGGLDGQRTTKQVAWCITSIPPARADAADLGHYLRGHWSIENSTHWVRDVTFHEDHSTLHTRTAPQTMAIIRNLIITALRLTGWANLAQARRYYAHDMSRTIDLIARPVKSGKSRSGAGRAVCRGPAALILRLLRTHPARREPSDSRSRLHPSTRARRVVRDVGCRERARRPRPRTALGHQSAKPSFERGATIRFAVANAR